MNGIKQEWEKRSSIWNKIAHPLRPSRGDLKIYELLASEKLSANILLLGATPELRDLGAKKNGHITVVDLNGAVIHKMSKFLKIANSQRETWVESDWRNINFKEGSFDLVIGDLILWLLSLADQKILIKNIHRALSPEGLFI